MLTQSAEAVSQHISLAKAGIERWNFKLFPFTLSPEFEVSQRFRLLWKVPAASWLSRVHRRGDGDWAAWQALSQTVAVCAFCPLPCLPVGFPLKALREKPNDASVVQRSGVAALVPSTGPRAQVQPREPPSSVSHRWAPSACVG